LNEFQKTENTFYDEYCNDVIAASNADHIPNYLRKIGEKNSHSYKKDGRCHHFLLKNTTNKKESQKYQQSLTLTLSIVS